MPITLPGTGESVDTNSGAKSAGTQRMILASDDPAVTAVTAIQASAAIMDDWDEADRAKVNLIVGQAGIAAGSGVDGATVPRVSLATDVALPAGDNNIGNVDIVTLPGELSGPGTPTIDSYNNAAINVAAGATNAVVITAPGANKQIWVYGISYICNVAGTVSIQDEDDTAITGVQRHGANGGRVTAPSGNFAMPLWKVGTNKALEMDTVTCEVDGDIQYAIVDVA